MTVSKPRKPGGCRLPRLLAPLLLVSASGGAGRSAEAQVVAGQNINMVSGTQWPGGDPFLQRQNEPSLAVSSRNPLHLLAGANDYRTVDLPTEPGSVPGTLSGDAWLGVFKSFDGGLSWQSTLLAGYPQDTSPAGTASPLKAYGAAADPTVRAGANGLFYYSGIAFNRGTNIGTVFVSRFFDRDDKENGVVAAGGDPVAYLDTKLIDTGTSGQFLDKPWIAVDVARTGSGATTCAFTPPGGTAQSFVGGNVYMTWSRFTGSASTKIMFSRSFDCGKTWSTPIKLSESNSINQGTNIAVDPVNGYVYVAWRRFATSSAPDAILVAKSTDFGKSFSTKNTVQVATITPFDQGTSGTQFRTNALPSIAVSVDASGVPRVHVAWAQRSATNQNAQVVVATSPDGLNWTAPAMGVDTAPLTDDSGATFSRGHQFMPQLTFSQGRLMVLYYDQRFDHTLGLVTPNNPFGPDASGSFYRVFREVRLEPAGAAPVFGLTIDDLGLVRRRHTIDLRVARALPGATPSFLSTSVSQYKIGLRAPDAQGIFRDEEGTALSSPPTSLSQLQVNAPNLPLFAQGTVPFLGDYIDIAGPTIVPNGTGGWKFNAATTSAPVFYATWTDNRDVVSPRDGDWTHYTPVGGGATSVLSPPLVTPTCVPGQEGMRNQNIYASRITEGLLVGSPQNIKPLFAAPKSRAFIVTLQNLTSQDRTFTVTLTPGPGVSASFQQTAATTQLANLTIPAHSGAARPVFASSASPAGSVTVNVVETGPGSIGLSGSVILNPEGSVSPLAQPDGTTVDIGTVEIYTPSLALWNPANPNPFLNIADPNISNPNISNPNISNPNISNADPAIFNVANPNISNPNISNPNISNPNISNRNISNPDPAVLGVASPNISNTIVANPNISNPNISNPNISNAVISETTYALTNSGNTTHSYRVALYGNNPTGKPLQIIVTKNYSTPTSVGCTLQNVPQSSILANVNAAVVAPTLSAATDPNIPDGATTNATMALAPGETAFVTLRGTLTQEEMTQLARSLTPVVTAHGVGTNGATNDYALLLFIQTAGGTVLPAAIVGSSYTYTVQIVGGKAPLNWSWAPASGSSLPPGLGFSGGVISGTPTAAGSFSFSVSVTDSSAVPQTATQTFSLTINSRATLTSVSFGVNPAVVAQAVPVTVTVTDSERDGTASSPTGTVTFSGDPGLAATNCVLTPLGMSSSTCSVTLTPGSAGARTISANYPGSSVHTASGGGAGLTANPRTTTTSVSFTPNPATVLAPAIVAATVADVETAGTPSSPVGAVTFSSSVPGDTFSATTCSPSPVTSTMSSCSVTVTSSTNATRTITASYGGSAFHAPSSSTASLTASYYNFTGFLSPLSTAGTLTSPTFSGTQNNGSAVPLKWQLRDGSGSFLTSLSTTQLIQAVAYSGGLCSGQASGSTLLLYSPTNGATGGSTFRYDTTNNQFMFNWDTSFAFGPGCYEVVLTLNDGSPPRATTVRLQ